MSRSETRKFFQQICKSLCAIILLFGSTLLMGAAGCPNPPEIQGYLGNLGTTSGNCAPTFLPPLCAFGSLTINQNGPLGSVNRLNPTQLPTTNNFQIFQNPCAIIPTTWTFDAVVDPVNSLFNGGSTLKMRHGPFLVGMTRVGPVVTIAQYNFNQAGNPPTGLPDLLADARTAFFFSAAEGTTTFFNVSTNVVNAQTCLVTYTPKSGAAGKMVDYNVIGNVFHDVFYDNLTPNLAIGAPLFFDAPSNSLYVAVDNELGGSVQLVPFGTSVTGKSFIFYANRSGTLGPSIFLIYAVNNGDNPVTLTVTQSTGAGVFITMSTPYTGFFRLAAISTNDPAPTTMSVGHPWVQNTLFMPEDVNNGNDTSKDPPSSVCPPPMNNISSCAIEDPTCCQTPTQTNWWKTPEVHVIAPTGLNFYMLFPATWANLFFSLAFKVMNSPWVPPTGSSLNPDFPGLSILLPALAMSNPTQAGIYYQNFFSASNPTMTAPFTDLSDFSTNLFLVQFDMFMGGNLVTSGEIPAFQTASRTFPSYAITFPVDNVAVYNAHRRYVPVQADITTTANSIQWTYTLSSDVPPGDGMNKTLVCFPFWKYLQGTPQNFIFNDTIKGTLYAAEAINGSVTFLEGGMPSWYNTATPFSLFIPNTLTFTSMQQMALSTAFAQLSQLIVPLPYFSENFLDTAYNAGKTIFMLAKTGLYAAYFLHSIGRTNVDIITLTQPYIDNAKSCLTAYLVGRTPGSSFFIADRTGAGICVNGAGGAGEWAQGPNLQQFTDSGVDFGNYVYNDHHFFAGYYIMAAAMITNWEMIYGSGSFWLDVGVTGGDGMTYTIRNIVDFLWRDTHNPFTNDPDLPYNRYGFPWEGHSVANGLQYTPNTLGRDQESIGEDFNCWTAINIYANLVLQMPTVPSSDKMMVYQPLADFSLMNIKMTATAGIQWFKNTNFWAGTNLWSTTPTSTHPAIYIGQFTQQTVTNGKVNDQSAENFTFF